MIADVVGHTKIKMISQIKKHHKYINLSEIEASFDKMFSIPSLKTLEKAELIVDIGSAHYHLVLNLPDGQKGLTDEAVKNLKEIYNLHLESLAEHSEAFNCFSLVARCGFIFIIPFDWLDNFMLAVTDILCLAESWRGSKLNVEVIGV